MIQLIFDIETNGLEIEEVDTIWCISIWDGETLETYTADIINRAVERLNNADMIVGHNIILYDIPVIKKLFPYFNPKSVEDTFIMSSLFDADRHNGHSLEAWGAKFGIPKKTIKHRFPKLDFIQTEPFKLNNTRFQTGVLADLCENFGCQG